MADAANIVLHDGTINSGVKVGAVGFFWKHAQAEACAEGGEGGLFQPEGIAEKVILEDELVEERQFDGGGVDDSEARVEPVGDVDVNCASYLPPGKGISV